MKLVGFNSIFPIFPISPNPRSLSSLFSVTRHSEILEIRSNFTLAVRMEMRIKLERVSEDPGTCVASDDSVSRQDPPAGVRASRMRESVCRAVSDLWLLALRGHSVSTHFVYVTHVATYPRKCDRFSTWWRSWETNATRNEIGEKRAFGFWLWPRVFLARNSDVTEA